MAKCYVCDEPITKSMPKKCNECQRYFDSYCESAVDGTCQNCYDDMLNDIFDKKKQNGKIKGINKMDNNKKEIPAQMSQDGEIEFLKIENQKLKNEINKLKENISQMEKKFEIMTWVSSR